MRTVGDFLNIPNIEENITITAYFDGGMELWSGSRQYTIQINTPLISFLKMLRTDGDNIGNDYFDLEDYGIYEEDFDTYESYHDACQEAYCDFNYYSVTIEYNHNSYSLEDEMLLLGA